MDKFKTIQNIVEQPNLIDEIGEVAEVGYVTLLGWALGGREEDCLIIKVVENGTESRALSPDGALEFNSDWANRNDGTYTFELIKL